MNETEWNELPVSPPEGEKHILLRQQAPFFLLLAAGLGAVYALLFCRADYRGLNTLIYHAVWCVVMQLALRRLGVESRKSNSVWFVSVLLLSLTVCWTANDFVQAVSRAGILLCQIFLLLGAFADMRDWHFGKAAASVMRLGWYTLGRCLEPFRHLHAMRSHARDGSGKYILIGLAAAIPLAVIVLSLLSSADIVFDGFLRRLFDWDLPDFFETFFRALGLFLLASLAFYGALCAQTDRPESAEQKGVKKANTLVAITFTAVLAIIYALFCGIQIAVFFGGNVSALPDGYTYAEYAREGFFELLVVSGINLLLVIVSQRRFAMSRALRILLTFISACTYLMIVCSAQRMLLYVSVYGFTFLRLLVLWFLAVLAILMGGTLWTVYHPGFRLFTFSVGVCLAMWLLFAFARPDRIAARYNFERFGPTDAAASCAVYELSLDAVPVMTGYEYDGESSYFAEEWNGYLTQYVPREYKERGLRCFNISVWLADRAAEEYTNG